MPSKEAEKYFFHAQERGKTIHSASYKGVLGRGMASATAFLYHPVINALSESMSYFSRVYLYILPRRKLQKICVTNYQIDIISIYGIAEAVKLGPIYDFIPWKTYKMKAGGEPTSNLRPVTAPVVPLFTRATLIRPLFLQATVSIVASSKLHSSHSS